ncbi:MAG: DUF5752 family protein [Candidatus Heimdallarchaeota archaeon]
MANSVKEQPFRFFRTTTILEFARKRASNLSELLDGIRSVDDLSIAFHMLTPLFKTYETISKRTNDFSNWTKEILQEKELSEHLTAIDPYQLRNITELRNQLELVIEEFLLRPQGRQQALRGDEFQFHTITRFIFPTNHFADNLAEFANILKQVDESYIYHHFVEPRAGIRPIRGDLDLSDDFTMWIAANSENKSLVNRLAELDPYLLTMEEIRRAILSIIEDETSGGNRK